MTGGNSGIGVETVKTLAMAGSRVVLTSRSEEAGIKVAEQLKSEGVKASRQSLTLSDGSTSSVTLHSSATEFADLAFSGS